MVIVKKLSNKHQNNMEKKILIQDSFTYLNLLTFAGSLKEERMEFEIHCMGDYECPGCPCINHHCKSKPQVLDQLSAMKYHELLVR